MTWEDDSVTCPCCNAVFGYHGALNFPRPAMPDTRATDTPSELEHLRSLLLRMQEVLREKPAQPNATEERFNAAGDDLWEKRELERTPMTENEKNSIRQILNDFWPPGYHSIREVFESIEAWGNALLQERNR
jgi:hypothetical protein